MEKKEMKNIKKPSYACEMGNGLFVAGIRSGIWQCQLCGEFINMNPGERPSAKGCPSSNSGNHVWK